MSRLGRWSQRKRDVTTRESAHDLDATDAAWVDESDDEARAVLAGKPPIDSLETASETEPEPGSLDHTLPDPETLPPGSDIKAFLVPGVSAGLRRRALRRLFAADHYGVRDGLDDYDDDYRRHLKPLASELAQRVRQWTRQEADEAAAHETQADAPERRLTKDEAGTAEERQAITEDEEDALHREGVLPQSALDEGSGGENTQSDQH